MCAFVHMQHGVACPLSFLFQLSFTLSPGELLQWLERRHLLHGLVTDSNPVLGPGLQPLPQTSHHHRHHRAAATNPARYCCLSGCTQQDLLTLCPY